MQRHGFVGAMTCFRLTSTCLASLGPLEACLEYLAGSDSWETLIRRKLEVTAENGIDRAGGDGCGTLTCG